MNNNPLIIERPELQNWRQKAVFGVLTALFWMLWVLLWLPLITLLGWLFFGYQFQLHMLALEGYKGLAARLAVYAIVVLVMGGSLLLWAKYNHLRFRGRDRRKEGSIPSAATLALLHGRTAAEISHWQSCAVVTVHHDEDGRIQRIVPDEKSPEARPPGRSLYVA